MFSAKKISNTGLGRSIPQCVIGYGSRENTRAVESILDAMNTTFKSSISSVLAFATVCFLVPTVASAVDGYTSRNIEGWPVRVSDTLMKDQPEATKLALELLADQLRKVKKMLPKSALAKVINVPIWFSPEYKGVRPTGEYHPGKGWLKSQGRRPELHRCIEFTNIPIFEREIKRMPVLVLHELAHAYHDQVLGFDDAEVKATYGVALSNGSYESVKRGNAAKKERAYAITNDREYFAETTEAYFGRNDFYPFDRDDLELHDPRMAKLLKRLWQDDIDER